MRGWLFNLAYAAAALLTAPVWLTRLVRHGKYRRDWSQRLGRIPRRWGLGPVIWIHGVSVGEINAAGVLVDQLHEQLPDYRVVISSTTDTGLAAARRLFAPAHEVFRYPMDFTFSVRTALARLRPDLVVLMEGDVWPNFTRECRRRGIAVAVVNGRLGPRKGYPRYRLIRPLAARLFNSLTAIGVQHEDYAELFASLGVRREKLFVTGMMKYDTADVADRVAGQESLAEQTGIGADERVLVAGGTGAGEEEQVLAAMAATSLPDGQKVRLVIVPRKPERFDEVARLIAASGQKLVRRSECLHGAPPVAAGETLSVILGDTMGELRKFYGLAFGVFVGRSLTPEGGSDMIEAAALGKPVAMGPHTFNFPQAETMVRAGAARRVEDATELAATWSRWLADPAGAAELGRKGQEFVQANRGATRRNVEMLCRLLGRVPSETPGGVATPAVEAAGTAGEPC